MIFLLDLLDDTFLETTKIFIKLTKTLLQASLLDLEVLDSVVECIEGCIKTVGQHLNAVVEELGRTAQGNEKCVDMVHGDVARC